MAVVQNCPNYRYFIYSDNYTEADEAFIEAYKISKITKESNLQRFNRIIKSPGISNFHPIIVKLIKLNYLIETEIDFAFDYAPNSKYVVITGSNGKSTCVMLAYNLLQRYFKDVRLAGNIGLPLISQVKNATKDTIFCLELSSYQLETIQKIKPYVFAITNLIPTHLEYHKTIENYINAKLNGLANGAENLIYLANNQLIDQEQISKFTIQNIYQINQIYEDFKQLPLKGDHNLENYQLVYQIAKCFNLSKQQFINGVQKFKGLEHRMEIVLEKPILVINDSKATNVDSTIKALSAFDKAVVILGGDNLIQDINLILHTNNYFFGYQNDILAKSTTFYVDFKTAVEEAYKFAVAKNLPLILSPAYPSFGQFRNFEHRGNTFKKIIEEISCV